MNNYRDLSTLIDIFRYNLGIIVSDLEILFVKSLEVNYHNKDLLNCTKYRMKI